MTISDSDVLMLRHLCPRCRGDGVVVEGNAVGICQECERRDWEEFHAGKQDSPPCFGYASCSGECMMLCQWAEGCKEVVR